MLYKQLFSGKKKRSQVSRLSLVNFKEMFKINTDHILNVTVFVSEF